MYNSNKIACNPTCHNGWKLQPTNLSRRKVKPLILKLKSNTYSTSCLTSRFQMIDSLLRDMEPGSRKNNIQHNQMQLNYNKIILKRKNGRCSLLTMSSKEKYFT